ncbi:Clavaminate synthase-like protein [Mycena sanguinolenta]|uniref:Clavaminate synthase-like protein n=1 Tax=Mycena sanguinolenta TaxID=230812 RepID=A0A8H7D3H1_9AGAR|nr:Clavaminate synthase-like protein [Mycena sanguinolenta]
MTPPTSDLSSISSTDPAARRALADEIKHACMEVGFFYGTPQLHTSLNFPSYFETVKNHGIPETVMQDTLAQMTRFFDLPLDKKLEVENKKTSNFMGYNPVLSGNNDPNGAGDLQEGFEFKFEPLDDGSHGADKDTAIARGGHHGCTSIQISPGSRNSGPPSHRALKLGRLLFPLFALALDLPEDFFADKTKHSAAIMRLLHYPPQFGEVDDRVIGIGAHTDWECFTILWQQPGIQALQVLNSFKEWINVPAIDGTLVINLGDQFARWTNDVFTSTVHRAINRSGVERYSIPLFFGTDYNVPLEPISSCVSDERPARYEAITAGEYIRSRHQATYGHY